MPLLDLLHTVPKVRILDLGAIDTGDRPSYWPLVEYGCCEIIAFDPFPEECHMTEHLDGKITTRLIPRLVGDGSRVRFHHCKLKSTSSVFVPNYELCSYFQGFAEPLEVVNVSEEETVRLDDVAEIVEVDLLKSDTQGSEVAAFHGGRRILESVLAVEVEVELVPQYIDQPLFGDVDVILRRSGQLFHAFLSYGSLPLVGGGVKGPHPLRQWLWTTALYVRDLRRWPELSAERLLKLAILLDIYNSYEFAHKALTLYDQTTGSTLAERYSGSLRTTVGQPPILGVRS